MDKYDIKNCERPKIMKGPKEFPFILTQNYRIKLLLVKILVPTSTTTCNTHLNRHHTQRPFTSMYRIKTYHISFPVHPRVKITAPMSVCFGLELFQGVYGSQ